MNTKLIGMLDSPYVRRTAVALQLMEVEFEHLPLSVFTQYYEFSQLNPAVKAPSLVIDDGSILMDSGLILQYASVISKNSWSAVPNVRRQRAAHLRLEGISLVVMEKAVQLVQEQRIRPPEKQHSPWIVRLGIQLSEALDLLEAEVKCHQWDFRTAPPTLPEVSAAVAWTFCMEMVHTMVEKENHPVLSTLTAEAELLECFRRAPHSTLKYPVLLQQSAESNLDLQA